MMRMRAEFWATHVAASQLETIPASEYAKRHDLPVKSLYYWRRKLNKSNKTDTALPSGQFVALRIAPSGSRPNNYTLALPIRPASGMSALPQPEWLAALARAVPGVH